MSIPGQMGPGGLGGIGRRPPEPPPQSAKPKVQQGAGSLLAGRAMGPEASKENSPVRGGFRTGTSNNGALKDATNLQEKATKLVPQRKPPPPPGQAGTSRPPEWKPPRPAGPPPGSTDDKSVEVPTKEVKVSPQSQPTMADRQVARLYIDGVYKPPPSTLPDPPPPTTPLPELSQIPAAPKGPLPSVPSRHSAPPGSIASPREQVLVKERSKSLGSASADNRLVSSTNDGNLKQIIDSTLVFYGDKGERNVRPKLPEGQKLRYDRLTNNFVLTPMGKKVRGHSLEKTASKLVEQMSTGELTSKELSSITKSDPRLQKAILKAIDQPILGLFSKTSTLFLGSGSNKEKVDSYKSNLSALSELAKVRKSLGGTPSVNEMLKKQFGQTINNLTRDYRSLVLSTLEMPSLPPGTAALSLVAREGKAETLSRSIDELKAAIVGDDILNGNINVLNAMQEHLPDFSPPNGSKEYQALSEGSKKDYKAIVDGLAQYVGVSNDLNNRLKTLGNPPTREQLTSLIASPEFRKYFEVSNNLHLAKLNENLAKLQKDNTGSGIFSALTATLGSPQAISNTLNEFISKPLKFPLFFNDMTSNSRAEDKEFMTSLSAALNELPKIGNALTTFQEDFN